MSYKTTYKQMMLEEMQAVQEMDGGGSPAVAPPASDGAMGSAGYMQQFHDNPKTAAYNTGGSIIIPITKRKIKGILGLQEGEECSEEEMYEKCKAHLVEFLSEVLDVEEVEIEGEDANEVVMLKLSKMGDQQGEENPDQQGQQPQGQPQQGGQQGAAQGQALPPTQPPGMEQLASAIGGPPQGGFPF